MEGLMRAEFIGLFFTLTLAVQLPDAPQGVIDKAIQARGGEKQLPQVVAIETKVRGRIFRDPVSYPFTTTILSQLPDQYKHVMDYQKDNETIRQTQIFTGTNVWLKARGELQPLDEKLIDALRRGRYAERLTNLTLLKDKAYQIKSLGDSKAYDHDVTGIEVTGTNKIPVKLFFDKATGLLVKTEHRQMDPQSLEEVLQTTYYSDYRIPDTTTADETIIKKARIKLEPAALLEHLRKLKGSGVDPDQIRALIQKLGDDSFEVREKATEALITMGEPAVPFLQIALKSNDLEVSRRAEHCLKSIRKDPAERQGEEAVWIAIVRTLARQKPTGAIECLLDFLPHAANPEVEREVRYALRLLASRDGSPNQVLEKALEDKDPRRRKAAAEALGRAVPLPGSRLLLPDVKYPMKGITYRDGRKFMEWEVREVLFLNKIDDKEFVMP
jgi:hypothetical protein